MNTQEALPAKEILQILRQCWMWVDRPWQNVHVSSSYRTSLPLHFYVINCELESFCFQTKWQEAKRQLLSQAWDRSGFSGSQFCLIGKAFKNPFPSSLFKWIYSENYLHLFWNCNQWNDVFNLCSFWKEIIIFPLSVTVHAAETVCLWKRAHSSVAGTSSGIMYFMISRQK